ncbi:MAG: hypothetical protein ACPGYX_12440, partial [Oceanobacter sp.]
PGIQINLPAGELNLYEPVVIPSDISLVGKGTKKTTLVSNISGNNQSALLLEGNPDDSSYILTRSFNKGDKSIYSKGAESIQSGDLILIRIRNSDAFFKSIGSKFWKEETPYLRQQLVRAVAVDRESGKIDLSDGLVFGTLRGESGEFIRVKPTENVVLKGFTLEQKIPGADIHRTDGVYENLYPEYLVDGIVARYAANLAIEKVDIINSGNDPLVFTYCYGCEAVQLTVKGAWNKGAYGNGYVRFDKAFNSRIDESDISEIRHLTFQWSSANNRVDNSRLGVDVNFNGGYTSNNQVSNTNFEIPQWHPWPEVYFTPGDANWAPPDGKGNMVNGVEYP